LQLEPHRRRPQASEQRVEAASSSEIAESVRNRNVRFPPIAVIRERWFDLWMRLKVGDRVRVSSAHFRAQGAIGVVISKRQASFGGGLKAALARAARTLSGREPVWVRFDQPQDDGDGDGPYVIATVDADALNRIT